MATIAKKYTYSPGTVASATQVDEEFTQLVDAVNDKYSKAEIDAALENLSVGGIPDGTLEAVKVTDVFGRDINISQNPSILSKAPTTHNHDSAYSALGHNHDTNYLKTAGGNALNNNTALQGKDSGGVARNLIFISDINNVGVGNATYPLILYSSTTPRYISGGNSYDLLVLDVSGNINIGTKTVTAGWSQFTNAGCGTVLKCIGTSTGYISIFSDTTLVGNIGKTGSSANMMISSILGMAGLYSNDKSVVMDGVANEFRPSVTGSVKCGTPTFKWSELHSTSGTINPSDRNLKQQIAPIPDEVLDAWAEINYCQFKFNDAVAAKGENARLHLGMIAQDIEAAFIRHGLDAFKYGLLCYDEWPDQYEDVYEQVEKIDEAGRSYIDSVYKETVLVLPAGSEYSIRPDECQFLEMALMRRELNILKGGV